MSETRLLIVEDEFLLRLAMAEVLRDAGYSVDEAANADDAEKLLVSDGYNLLVTDVHMPGSIDGAELATRLHDRKPDVPVVFVTGRPDAVRKLSDSGIRGITLAKPFELKMLVGVVEQFLTQAA